MEQITGILTAVAGIITAIWGFAGYLVGKSLGKKAIGSAFGMFR